MHPANMPKPKADPAAARRLKDARISDERFATGADAARAMGQGVSTYLGHENASRGFVSEAARYADFYKVNLDWLVTGKGAMKRIAAATASDTNPGVDITKPVTTSDINLSTMPRDVPILGSGSCGEDGLFELNGQTLDHAKRPPRLIGVKDAYALWVTGLSMAPWRRHGELVYVHPHQPINVGDFVVVQLKPERSDGLIGAYIKELTRRTAKELRLKQYNPAEEITIPMSKVGALHRIVDWSELMGL